MQLEDWLDDLCVRFIVNIPAEELASIERICFQIEEAQWFYEDFIRPLDPSLPSLSLKPFFQRITQRCPLFQDWPEEDMGDAFEKFIKYKNRVPVRGAILLNETMDEVLLVKGWKKNGTWSFPRGKINKDEDDLDCAIREAWEETGFDIKAAGLTTDPRKVKHIEKTMRSQNMKLFVFRGVPQDANFVPQTRKEISKIQWFRLVDLPTEKKKNQSEGTGQHLVLNANKFYVVAPFMYDLKKIIHAERKKDQRQSSKLAAAPMTTDPVLVAEQEHAATTGLLALPLSPLVPSSLPEVTSASAQDALLHLKQQLNVPLASQSSDVDSRAKSNDLLSLLRKGSAAEMRNDPHTPLHQTTSLTQPPSPKRPPPESQLHRMNMQSPPPSSELHPQAHPTAPPLSALPQLNQHTRSLLDAFSKPSMPRSPAADAVKQLPASKQHLLAAFTAQSKVAPQSTPSSADNAANGLLQMLQRKHKAAVAAEAPGPKESAVRPEHPTTLTMTSPPVRTQQETPALRSSFDPLAIVQQRILSNSASAAQQPRSWASVTATAQQSSQVDALSDPPAISNLVNPVPHIQQQIAQDPASVAHPPRSWASIATSAKPPPQPTKIEPVAKSRPEPAELSATPEHPAKHPPTDTGKPDAPSLLGSVPSKAPKIAGPKSRSGTTAANLDRPIDEPDFDTIVRASTFDDEAKREPVTGDRKLFDPKQGEPKHSPAAVRVMSRHDDRHRAPKSPRPTRQKQSQAPRPVTPKEIQKPFQPQILKRPQTSEGEAPLGLPPSLAQSSAAQMQLAAPSTMSPFPTPASGPLSPSINAPQAVTAAEINHFFSPATRSVPQDPSKAALLDFLRTPTQQPTSTKADADATPKQFSAGFAPSHQASFDQVVSPPSANQLVSPMLDNHHDIHAPRSRVSSLASTAPSNAGAKPQIEKRQTNASDKAFLMSYLKNIAGQEAT